MEILITGGSGKVGSAIIDHLSNTTEYRFTILARNKHPDYKTITGNVTDYAEIRPAFDGIDAVIHLAVYPQGLEDENWEQINAVNIHGTYNVMEAARDAGVEKVIFGSTNHVVGMYELEHKPDIYYPESDITIDHTDPVRPDSYYGVSKLLGENLGRFYVEQKQNPTQFYALRICTLNDEEYDHPYGDAEQMIEEQGIQRGLQEYQDAVARMKAMWFSRRDCAQMIDLMLQDRTVDFDIFYGLSSNDRRWLDIEHAKDILNYSPQDNGDEWDAPPK